MSELNIPGFIAFLRGEVTIDGHWFGGDGPIRGGIRRNFWWREHLPKLSSHIERQDAEIAQLRADLSESRCLLESSEAALQEAQRALYRWLPNRIGSEYDDLIAADAMTLMGLESVDGLREIGGEILIELVEKRRLLDEARAQKPVAFRYRIGGPTVEWRYAPGDATLTRSAIVESEPLYAAAPVPAQPAGGKGSTHCDDCGCDWLDNGLNPVGCPYCKRNDDKFNPCLNSLVRQVTLMMDDCEEHADGTITIDCDISQGFLRRIYDLLSALEDGGYDAMQDMKDAGVYEEYEENET